MNLIWLESLIHRPAMRSDTRDWRICEFTLSRRNQFKAVEYFLSRGTGVNLPPATPIFWIKKRWLDTAEAPEELGLTHAWPLKSRRN